MAEQVEKERVEQLKKLEDEQASITTSERELLLKKQQLHDAVKVAAVEDEEMDGDDGHSDVSESTTPWTMVHPNSLMDEADSQNNQMPAGVGNKAQTALGCPYPCKYICSL